MPKSAETILVAAEWVRKAEHDFKSAVHLLKIERECPTDVVCFHAQQCVEKYMKAILVLNNIDFTRTHDVEALVNLLPRGVHPNLASDEQRRLTSYATVARYPGSYEPISVTEARQAVRIARRVRQQLRKVLPKEVVRQRRR